MPSASCKRCCSSSPDRLHDLHAIAVPQFVQRMPAARDDFAVHFDGDAALAMAGFGEQPRNGGCRCAFMWLAIEMDLHAGSLAPHVGNGGRGQPGWRRPLRSSHFPDRPRGSARIVVSRGSDHGRLGNR